MDTRFLAIPTLALVFLGAGCAPQTTPPVSQPAPNAGTNVAPQAEQRTLVPTQTDDTWKTYANPALKFSFLFPTKGRYAPQWEVKIFRRDAAEVQDCYAVPGASIGQVRLAKTPEGRAFCTIRGSEGAAGTAYFTDAYQTKIGTSAVVVIFTKKAFMADIGDCVRAPGQNFWSEFAKPGSCIPFSEEEYQKTLDGIMGTFKVE